MSNGYYRANAVQETLTKMNLYGRPFVDAPQWKVLPARVVRPRRDARTRCSLKSG